MKAEIHDRGRGPEIKGTRITVYDVYDYRDCSARFIAELFKITVEQVEAARAYIEAHKTGVVAAIAEFDARAAKGNSLEVRAKLEESHKKILAIKEQLRREGKLPPPPPPSPKIKGTDVTLDDIEAFRGAYTPEFIAEWYRISVEQVKEACANLEARESRAERSVSSTSERNQTRSSPERKRQTATARREKAHA